MSMAVGRRLTDDPDVIEIANDEARSPWARLWIRASGALAAPKIRNFGEPARWLRRFRGREDMEFPGSHRLLELAHRPVDVVHAHNLHGAGTGFFDLRALPELAARVPVILTLHDGWLLAGHCAHSFDCDRWMSGCGRCPDLSIPEMIRRDGSAANFDLKRRVFERCSLHLAAPSRWLMDRARQSLLAPAITDCRVIPNGIDLGTFKPGNRAAERRRLGLDQDIAIILSVGNTLRTNIWRDFDAARAAVQAAADGNPRHVLFLGLGDSGESIRDSNLEIRFVPHRDDIHEVASYLRAADVLLHSSRADTFPTVVLEAMACGLPVVASAVGGIPEQVVDGETGFLVASGDGPAMAGHLQNLLIDPEIGSRLGRAAAERAERCFGQRLMVDRYLEWYRELAEDSSSSS
jgi:glycosyltransferase involved in cell wall biosynthesis